MHDITPQQKFALEDISLSTRVAVSVLYWPVSLGLLLWHYATQPFLFTYEVWNRLLMFVGIWDEPLVFFATAGTWLAPFLFLIWVLV